MVSFCVTVNKFVLVTCLFWFHLFFNEMVYLNKLYSFMFISVFSQWHVWGTDSQPIPWDLADAMLAWFHGDHGRMEKLGQIQGLIQTFFSTFTGSLSYEWSSRYLVCIAVAFSPGAYILTRKWYPVALFSLDEVKFCTWLKQSKAFQTKFSNCSVYK